jgi:hypothetical protein
MEKIVSHDTVESYMIRAPLVTAPMNGIVGARLFGNSCVKLRRAGKTTKLS